MVTKGKMVVSGVDGSIGRRRRVSLRVVKIRQNTENEKRKIKDIIVSFRILQDCFPFCLLLSMVGS